MDAVLFLCFWLGGAAVHTLIELRLRTDTDAADKRENVC